MTYGITASAIFQRTAEQVLGTDIKNIVVYLNDICLGYFTEEELNSKAAIVSNREVSIGRSSMTINEKGIYTYVQ